MRYKTAPGVILTSVCGHYYLVTAELSMEINEIVALCWKELEKGAAAEDLMKKAQNSFEVEDVVVLAKDIDMILESLFKQHLIMRCRS